MSDCERVLPRTLKGCIDYLPADLIALKRLIRKVEDLFEKYGFVPIETPALEYLETLLGTGGEETNKELFRFESPEGEQIALRFDLTVPFARLLAQYPDKLKAPFRRYAIGPSWRADKPGPGRFRQFTQFDIDVAGADSVVVDAELVAVMCEVMAAVGAPDYCVLVNNRKLVDALLEDCGIADGARHKHVLRIIDKLAKVGLENVRLELADGRIDESGDPIPGAGLDRQTVDKIVAFIGLSGGTRAGTVEALAGLLPQSAAAKAALGEMRELAAALDALGVSESHVKFDPSLARGLDYYTGPVFEVILPDAPQFGAVGGGGRYDGLVGRFMGRKIPCSGISGGLDRLMAALEYLGAIQKTKTTVQALVVTVGKTPKTEVLKIAAELRAAGIRTEPYFAKKKKMGMSDQLSHADHYGIPVAVIVGEDELAQGVVAVKDLRAGKEGRQDIADRDAYRKAGKTGQVTVPRAEMVETVKSLLASD